MRIYFLAGAFLLVPAFALGTAGYLDSAFFTGVFFTTAFRVSFLLVAAFFISPVITETIFLGTVFPLKCYFRLLENFTTPDVNANKVWSFPTPTFVPAIILVPRCLTMIEPTCADCPSASFVPKYLGFESRRFFAEPPAFLCAIMYVHSFQKNVYSILNVNNRKLG